MPVLIVLNGPPGVGKSTLAQRYVADHPFALDLDLDSVRRLVGGWRADPLRAGLRARALSLAMARDHLRAGHDVVLPQYLGNPDFLRDAEAVADECGARFVEIVLMDDRDTVVRRFAARTEVPDPAPVHRDAADLVAGLGGREVLFAMYDRLLLLLSARPDAVVLNCPEGAVEDVYRRVVAVVDRVAVAEPGQPPTAVP